MRRKELKKLIKKTKDSRAIGELKNDFGCECWYTFYTAILQNGSR